MDKQVSGWGIEADFLKLLAQPIREVPDFLKVGSILTVLILVIAILLVPRIWPLK
jgi:hypothetical protein